MIWAYAAPIIRKADHPARIVGQMGRFGPSAAWIRWFKGEYRPRQRACLRFSRINKSGNIVSISSGVGTRAGSAIVATGMRAPNRRFSHSSNERRTRPCSRYRPDGIESLLIALGCRAVEGPGSSVNRFKFSGRIGRIEPRQNTCPADRGPCPCESRQPGASKRGHRGCAQAVRASTASCVP